MVRVEAAESDSAQVARRCRQVTAFFSGGLGTDAFWQALAIAGMARPVGLHGHRRESVCELCVPVERESCRGIKLRRLEPTGYPRSRMPAAEALKRREPGCGWGAGRTPDTNGPTALLGLAGRRTASRRALQCVMMQPLARCRATRGPPAGRWQLPLRSEGDDRPPRSLRLPRDRSHAEEILRVMEVLDEVHTILGPGVFVRMLKELPLDLGATPIAKPWVDGKYPRA